MFAIREVCEIATSLSPILDESLMTRGVISSYVIDMVGPETMCLYVSNSLVTASGLTPSGVLSRLYAVICCEY